MFYNPSPPRISLSLDLLSEYRIQHCAIGPLCVTSSYSTWIFCRGVSGFATDCPCGVWCRGLTTCLLHVGPPFGNLFLNTSWAVGLTYCIVYLHFFCILTNAIIYVLIHHTILWLYLYFLNILYFFKYSCTNIFHRHSLCTFYSKWKYLRYSYKMTHTWWYALYKSCLLNPLSAKFFRGNINRYLHFMSYLHANTTQVVEISPRARQGPAYSTKSISWLLMSWRRKEPGHQQPWCWPS